MLKTTAGQILINEQLPEDLRDYRRILNKKSLKKLLEQIADKYPDQYRDITAKLSQLGAEIAYAEGASFSLKDLESSDIKKKVVTELDDRLERLLSREDLTDEQRNKQIIRLLVSKLDEIRNLTHDEGIKRKNSFSEAILSGARGNPANLSSLRGADLLVLDHKDRPIPVPILHNYSEGLDPAEYFATSYGTRKGIINTKLATAKAGFLSKQLANAAAPLLVTDEEPLPGTGLPVDVDDEDNEGSVLAANYGKFKAGTILTPSILKALKAAGYKEILVHSPITAGGRGVPRLAAGVREKGDLPPVGDNIGIASAQAVGEPLAQAQLSSKHGAGVVGASRETVSGFQAINQLITVPKAFRDAATLAQVDGVVDKIEKAPQGGYFVWIKNIAHYVLPEQNVIVKKGQRIEAGDSLTDGIPNPAELVKYKGIGEGRRYFLNRLRQTLLDQGIKIHRRNLEVLSRALLAHVKISEPDAVDGLLPDDIVDYDQLAINYKPRPGAQVYKVSQAKNLYLEKPVLHYSIGTRVTPSVISNLKKHKINEVYAHPEPPPFEPIMLPATITTVHDPDWFRRLSGFYARRGFMDAVFRGASSQIHSQHYQHSLAEAKDFGKELETKAIY